MPESTGQQEFNIRDYWRILVRRRWMLITCVMACSLTAAVWSLIATPVYRSTCTIAIERSSVRVLKQDLVSAEPSWLDYQNFYNTQYRILQSDRVLRTAAEKLGLRDTGLPDHRPGDELALARFKRQLVRAISRTSVPLEEDDADRPLIVALRRGLVISPVRDSHLVEVSFVSANRVFAARAANAVAEAYLNFTLAAKTDIAEASETFFIDRIAALRKEITAGEEGLRAYAREHNLVSGDASEAAVKNYDDLRERLTKTQADLAEAAAKHRAYSEAAPDSLPDVRESSLINQLSSAAAEAERDYREKLASYGSEYPEVLKARSKMEAARDKLRTETVVLARQAVDAAHVDFVNKTNQVEELQRLVDAARENANQFRGPYAEYLTRQKIVEAKRTTLNELLDKQNQMVLSANLGETGHNVRVIDQAQPARSIHRPRKTVNVAFGLLFGLLIGVCGVGVIEYIDNTLKTPEDIRQVLALPVLGMIPGQSGAQRRERFGKERRVASSEATGAAESEIDPALVTLRAPLSPAAESYRELRTAVLLATPGHPPRDLSVTSCQPGEGKTTTAINLGLALAQLGRKVLIVDTDLRRPRCHQLLAVTPTRGVSTYLTGLSTLDELVAPTPAERLWLLPAGPIPPNPAELLDSDRFRELVSSLRASGDYDHVIFDSPPVLSVVDPLLIGRCTEGAVLVIKSAGTSRESGRLGKEKLLAGRVNLLGVLLNAVPTEHVPYHYRYYRYGYSRRAKDGKEGASAGRASGEGVKEA